MTQLTDTQLVLLSAASQRADGMVPIHERLKGGVAKAVGTKLMALGLAEERIALSAASVWRESEVGDPLALFITAQGLAALGLGDDKAVAAGDAEQAAVADRFIAATGQAPVALPEDPSPVISACTQLALPTPRSDQGRHEQCPLEQGDNRRAITTLMRQHHERGTSSIRKPQGANTPRFPATRYAYPALRDLHPCLDRAWARHGIQLAGRPAVARKNGAHYRYYVSAALAQGRPAEAGTIIRVSATDIESAVAKHFALSTARSQDVVSDPEAEGDIDFRVIDRVIVSPSGLRLSVGATPIRTQP